jgi:hypothetical protein
MTALTAQHFCSIDADETLGGRDGTNKTVAWKKCASFEGTSHMRKRSFGGMPVPSHSGAVDHS